MTISRRFKQSAFEFVLSVLLLLDLVWWQSRVISWACLIYFIGTYLWHRREAVLNFRYSERLRTEMTLNAIKDIERVYTRHEDFNTQEKRARSRPPLDRHFYYARYERVQKLLDRFARKATRVLDMGCGFGRNTVYIRQVLQRPAVGLDMDSLKLVEAWRAAQEKSLSGGIDFVCGDVAQPPFRPASFDCILLTEILEHLIEPAEGLAACRELLCDGGLLIVTTPSSHNLNYSNNPILILEKLLSLLPDRILPPYHNLHARYEYNWRNPEPQYGMHYQFSWQELEALLERAGFERIWRGTFELEIFPFLLAELFAQGDLECIRKAVAPLEDVLEKTPLIKDLGQHLLWVGRKSARIGG
jgi:SAM-dependent methyltransferase